MAGDMTKKATFAGGCFWCMEPEFKSIDGVSKVVSGYTGGTVPNPTYEQVSTGDTGHFEAIEITYDPSKVSYMALLDIFWKNVDPLDDYGQFCDKGSQYRAGVFVHDDEQKVQAEISKEKVQGMFEKPIATVIRPAVEFWPAEDYHQDYYIKNKTRYKMYRYGCGRDEKLNILWNGKPKIAE
jgi:peptide-methionine (S)-S-oxide reductase